MVCQVFFMILKIVMKVVVVPIIEIIIYCIVFCLMMILCNLFMPKVPPCPSSAACLPDCPCMLHPRACSVILMVIIGVHCVPALPYAVVWIVESLIRCGSCSASDSLSHLHAQIIVLMGALIPPAMKMMLGPLLRKFLLKRLS